MTNTTTTVHGQGKLNAYVHDVETDAEHELYADNIDEMRELFEKLACAKTAVKTTVRDADGFPFAWVGLTSWGWL